MRLIDADALAINMCDCACADCDNERTINTKCSEIRWTYLKILDEQPTIEEQSAQPERIGWICPVCGRGLSPLTMVCPCQNGKGWEITCKT